jgi:hypothetical protein
MTSPRWRSESAAPSLSTDAAVKIAEDADQMIYEL